MFTRTRAEGWGRQKKPHVQVANNGSDYSTGLPTLHAGIFFDWTTEDRKQNSCNLFIRPECVYFSHRKYCVTFAI